MPACLSARPPFCLPTHPTHLHTHLVVADCRKMTAANCGKRFFPCGAAARKEGCEESTVQCGAEDFCASPADTMVGAARCLPLPPRCGARNNACCPPNKDGVVRERYLQDSTIAVPFCTDPASFCLWKYTDFGNNGLELFSHAGGKPILWDGYFERGYGQSRCAPLPTSCGNPGEPCCPSMQDRRISGMIHNRRFRYQPCNYNAAGKVGIYCKVSVQHESKSVLLLLMMMMILGAAVDIALCLRVGSHCSTCAVFKKAEIVVSPTSAAVCMPSRLSNSDCVRCLYIACLPDPSHPVV